jgi:hypothetical protein
MTHDNIDAPEHYTRFPVEPIEITQHLNFCRGNAVKYICRAGYKFPDTEIEDLQKAVWYLRKEIERLGGFDAVIESIPEAVEGEDG